MTHFLQDIRRRPQELEATLGCLPGGGRHGLQTAADAIRRARHVYLTGIGSSWHAAFGAGAIFSTAGRPVYMQDAGELVQFATFPAESVVIAISRSGRSAEIVNLLAKAREGGAKIIGITNSANGLLARQAHFPILVPALRAHPSSANTYSTLALSAAALACAAVASFDEQIAATLRSVAAETKHSIPNWQAQIAGNHRFFPSETGHFLGRGRSFGGCHRGQPLVGQGAKIAWYLV